MLNWEEIDKYHAKKMLEEIYENLHDDDLIRMNSTALEKRYGKLDGTINDFVFYREYTIDEIMKRLLIDDANYL
ncbi:MAG: hypothetical protein ACI9XO_001887 [Paraglaciecola sp.]|jgi:hypothetical protein